LSTFLPQTWSKLGTSSATHCPCILGIASSFYGSLRCSCLCNNSCRTCIERKASFRWGNWCIWHWNVLLMREWGKGFTLRIHLWHPREVGSL
jgi:hypothetical protein